MTSVRDLGLRYPKKIYKGRSRISPLPRWGTNWILTLGVLYGMWTFGLPILGFDTNAPDLLGYERAAQEAERRKWGVLVTPTYARLSQEYYSSSGGQALAVAQTMQAATVFAPTVTPFPTVTPLPSPTAGYNYPLSNHKFSFYDPMIGKDKPDIRFINCDKWNDVTQYCDSALRNGEAWENNYYIAAACPYDLYLAGAYFQVVSPDWLVALFPNGFTCKDTGEAVTGLFIDFLIPWRSVPFEYGAVPWGTPITLMRIR